MSILDRLPTAPLACPFCGWVACKRDDCWYLGWRERNDEAARDEWEQKDAIAKG